MLANSSFRIHPHFPIQALAKDLKPHMSPSPCPEFIIENIDSACMRSAANGDTDAFKSIVERWQKRLIAFFYRSLGNRVDAEDLTQETFVHLHRALPRYQARNAFNAFLFTLARRRLIDFQRHRARRPLDYIDPQDWPLQQQASPQNYTAEIERAFHRALQDLPDKQRQAILLLQQQDLSYDEIAETMGTSNASVKIWIHRARKHLRKALKEFRAIL
ncbi:MAG: ECF RNA polymerase sigma factor SigW [Opitutia bacterium UBA7350]|nr:MAG: ECF RNA polymerase sigma factor SigW [Opitutae bacterium UBA7350]